VASKIRQVLSDGASNNAATLLRYFVAEGCASGHAGLWMPP